MNEFLNLVGQFLSVLKDLCDSLLLIGALWTLAGRSVERRRETDIKAVAARTAKSNNRRKRR